MMKWRIVENEFNLREAPWRDAYGIEEDDPDVAAPTLVCWFYRGWSLLDVQRVVDQHNNAITGATEMTITKEMIEAAAHAAYHASCAKADAYMRPWRGAGEITRVEWRAIAKAALEAAERAANATEQPK